MQENILARGIEYDVQVYYGKLAEQVSSAASNYYELVCVTHGSVEYWIEDQYYKATGGDILLLPLGVMVAHTIKQRGCPCCCYHMWMSRPLLTRLKSLDSSIALCFETAVKEGQYLVRLPNGQFEQIFGAAEDIVAQSTGDKILNMDLSSVAMLVNLLAKLNRIIDRNKNVLCDGTKNRLVPVLQHIHNHCTEPLTVDKVAEMFDFSSSHLAHSFKKQMGTSLYHYVLLRRLQIGRGAMLRGVPVKDAYQQCGFGDYAGFYRAFTKEFGMSPQQYKKHNI